MRCIFIFLNSNVYSSMNVIRFLPFAIFVMWSGFLFLDLRWVSNVWMCQWFHSTISIQNSKNSTITKKHAKSKWKSHSARGRVIEWMLNNCWVACPWNGMTYFVWFLRRFFVDVFALVLVVVHNVHTSGHSNRRK